MNATNLTSLFTLILAVSIASERLITFVKTVIPWLSGSFLPGKPVDPKTERIRQLAVMLIAFIAAWVTSAFVGDSDFNLYKSISIGTPPVKYPVAVLGLLASGGSAFWTGLLGYTKAAKDIKTEQGAQEKVKTQALMALKPNNGL